MAHVDEDVERLRAELAGALVVGYDGSDAARRALRWGIADSRRRGVAIHVVRTWTISGALAAVEHPFGTVPSTAELEVALVEQTQRDITAEEPEGCEVVVHTVHGHSSKTLVAVTRDAELLVVGPRGAGGFGSLLLGSTTEQVLRHAKCTVVVVRGGP